MNKSNTFVAAGVIAGLCLVFTYTSTASAATGRVRESIKSKGKIAVENGQESLLIDSDDFYTLADEIDGDTAQLERLENIVGRIDAAPSEVSAASVGRFYMQGDAMVRCVEEAGEKKYQTIGSASSALGYLEQEISELKKSVSDGKKDVAATVTGLGVDAAEDNESFTELASKITRLADLWYEKGRKESFRGTATPAQVKKGKTFVNSSGEQTGAMKENGTVDVKLLSEGSTASVPGYSKYSEYTIADGYTSGGVVTVADLASQTSVGAGSEATPNQILEGYSAYVNGRLVEGKLKSIAGEYTFPKTWTPSNGFSYTSSAGLYSSYSVNAYWVWKKGYDEQYTASYSDGYHTGATVARNGG